MQNQTFSIGKVHVPVMKLFLNPPPLTQKIHMVISNYTIALYNGFLCFDIFTSIEPQTLQLFA